MAEVLEFKPLEEETKPSIVDQLRSLALLIESGDYHQVTGGVVVFDSNPVDVLLLGETQQHPRDAIYLLELGKTDMLDFLKKDE